MVSWNASELPQHDNSSSPRPQPDSGCSWAKPAGVAEARVARVAAIDCRTKHGWDGGDESVATPRAAKNWVAPFLQPRSGATGKPGTSVPDRKSGTESSPGGT